MTRHLLGWSQLVLVGALVVCFVIAVYTPADGRWVHQAIDAASFVVFELLLVMKLAFIRVEHRLKFVSLVAVAVVALGVLADSVCSASDAACNPEVAVFIPNFTSFAMAPAIAFGWTAALDMLGVLKPWGKWSQYLFGALFCCFLVRSALPADESTSVALMVGIWVIMATLVASLAVTHLDFER